MAEQRIVAPSLFLLLLLAVIAACGDSGSGSGAADPKGSSPRATLDTDFISRAVAACAPYADYQAKTFLDLQKFNRYAPDSQAAAPGGDALSRGYRRTRRWSRTWRLWAHRSPATPHGTPSSTTSGPTR